MSFSCLPHHAQGACSEYQPRDLTPKCLTNNYTDNYRKFIPEDLINRNGRFHLDIVSSDNYDVYKSNKVKKERMIHFLFHFKSVLLIIKIPSLIHLEYR